MLTPAEVAAVAREEGLADFADELVRWVRPGWRIVAAEGQPAIGRSKVGGHPDLAEGERWPVNSVGIPRTFVAQVDCRALPPLPAPWREQAAPWPFADSLLRLFTDALHDWEVGDAFGMTCDATARLRPALPPPVPDQPRPSFHYDGLTPQERRRYQVLPESAIRFEPFLTAPEVHPVLRPDLYDGDENADRYGQFAYRLRIDGAPSDGGGDDWPSRRSDPWEVHHLLGEASSVQHDVRSAGAMLHGGHEQPGNVPVDPALSDESAWTTLLGLYTEDLELDLAIHDGGAICIVAPIVDLAAGRLDRLVYSMDSC